MKWKIVLTLLLASVFWGCKKATPAAPEPAANTSALPIEAQPKLPTMKLYLGPETMDAELALSQRQEEIGMMFRTNIQETDSMLFVLPFPQRASFWMKNCPESLSAAYISPDGVIREIHHFEKNDETPVLSTNEDIQFVLETKDGWFTRHHIDAGMVVTTEHGPLADTFLRRR